MPTINSESVTPKAASQRNGRIFRFAGIGFFGHFNCTNDIAQSELRQRFFAANARWCRIGLGSCDSWQKTVAAFGGSLDIGYFEIEPIDAIYLGKFAQSNLPIAGIQNQEIRSLQKSKVMAETL
jgi:hypothetical protein